MVFSAISRNSAGTSSFGSLMPSSSSLNGALSHFSERRQCLPRPALELSVFLAASALIDGSTLKARAHRELRFRTAGYGPGALIKFNAPYRACALLNERRARRG